MNEIWSSSSSLEYKAKQFMFAAIFWALFNIVTGLLTGNHSLDDNYFILYLCLIVASINSSYKVSFNQGLVMTYQLGMVTQNINLYEASEVIEEKTKLFVHYPNDSRFKIKLGALSKSIQDLAKTTIVPREGEPAIKHEELDQNSSSRRSKPNYIQSLVGGFVLLVLGVVSIFTGIVYFPSKGGFIYASQDPIGFLFFQGFCFIVGVISVIYASYGLWRRNNA